MTVICRSTPHSAHLLVGASSTLSRSMPHSVGQTECVLTVSSSRSSVATVGHWNLPLRPCRQSCDFGTLTAAECVEVTVEISRAADAQSQCALPAAAWQHEGLHCSDR